MKKQTIELVLPKCPAWFIQLNTGDFTEELPKVEDFFSPTQLEYFVEKTSSYHGGFTRAGKLYNEIKKCKCSFSYGHELNVEWAETCKTLISAYISNGMSGSAFFGEEKTPISGVEEKLFESTKKVYYESIDGIKKKFAEWKLKEQERIHTKWIETFAKLVREP